MEDYFSTSERSFILKTVINTYDYPHLKNYTLETEIYLPYIALGATRVVTVGSNPLDSQKTEKGYGNGLVVSQRYLIPDSWSRAPDTKNSGKVNAVNQLLQNTSYPPSFKADITPAFDLDISKLLFASAALPATDTATASYSLDVKTTDQVETAGGLTLRFDASKFDKNLGAAEVTFDHQRVNLTNVPARTFLVAQHQGGAQAYLVGENQEFVNASDLSLMTFENCKVWLETTDTANRITYATLATQQPGRKVNITPGEGLTITSSNGSQEIEPDKPIEQIQVQVSDGYFLPEGYKANLDSMLQSTPTTSSRRVARAAVEGLQATLTDAGYTISGAPANDITLQLPDATEKIYNLEIPANYTFPTQQIGYKQISAQTFAVKNIGNWEASQLQLSLEGDASSSFTLNRTDTKRSLTPDETTTFTISPNLNLPVGTYTLTVKVTAEVNIRKSFQVQFTVEQPKPATSPSTTVKKIQASTPVQVMKIVPSTGVGCPNPTR